MKKKIVLYFPRVYSDTRPWSGTPLSLLAISRVLATEGYDIRIISDFLFEDSISEVVDQCKDSVCLGLSCMTGFQVYDALRVAKAVKTARPDLPIVWGGWHPSILPEETIQNEYVDIVIQGQGDRKFTDVVKRLANHSSLEGIPGITFKQADGSIASSPDCKLEDINNFPSYPYHLVDIEKCLDVTDYGRRTIQYISSYGCPHRCGFCVEPAVNKRGWTGLAAETVLDDWENLYKKYQIDSIAVYDSNFFVDKKRVFKICEGLLKRNIKIKWGNANGRVSQLIRYEPEIWEAMEQSGCQMILTGAESGSQETLDLLHKDMSIDHLRKFTDLCSKYHIKIFFSYLMGLPWSDNEKQNIQRFEEEFSRTCDQIAAMMDIKNGNRFSISVYTPYPGSELYDRALEHGFQAPRSLAQWSKFMAVPEDAFKTDSTRKWLAKSQSLRVTMLTQYIFGMMDLPTRATIAAKMNNFIIRKVFLFNWGIGLLLARARWRFRFWA
ncbi:hypothetical protein LCGC14_2295430, partial [marine sediment metagenome]